MKRTKKKKIIKDFAVHQTDTGSPMVQIAIINERIKELTKHLNKHKKDLHSRRGLIGLVGKRRKLLNYLQKHDNKSYEKILELLELRK